MPSITKQIVEITENNEVNVFYDTDLSMIDFDVWKTELERQNALLTFNGTYSRQTDYIVIGDLSKPYFNKSQLSRLKKAELIYLHEYYNKQYIDQKYWTKDRKSVV